MLDLPRNKQMMRQRYWLGSRLKSPRSNGQFLLGSTTCALLKAENRNKTFFLRPDFKSPQVCPEATKRPFLHSRAGCSLWAIGVKRNSCFPAMLVPFSEKRGRGVNS